MNITEIKDLYRATPFKPFDLVVPNSSTAKNWKK